MPLSEMLSRAAMAEAERKFRLQAEAQAENQKAQQKRLWAAFNEVCDFVPRGDSESAAWRWAALFMSAGEQLKAAGDFNRLEAMRYTGSDRLFMAGMEAAYEVCRLACVGRLADVKSALHTLIDSNGALESPFRLFLECVRDNRRWWSTTAEADR